jgi:hypothetical protein
VAIKALKIGPPHHRKRFWASEGEPDDGTAFTPRTPLPEIVVLIDAELMHESAPSPFVNGEAFNQEGVLSGLLMHKSVRLYRYSEDGPPPEVQPDAQTTIRTVFPGWAVLEPEVQSVKERCVVFQKGGSGFTLGGIFGNAVDVGGADTGSGAYATLPVDEAERRRRSDVLAAQVADQGVDADVFVTRRDYLLKAQWRVTRDATVCTPEEALTLIGLYLRRQNEFVLAKMGNDELRMNRGLFVWVGTRELLPEAWRWFSACVQHAGATPESRLGLLGQSLFERFGRALEARDRVHHARNQLQNNDLMDEALSNLDQVFLLLMSCVDIVARVAHSVLRLSGSERNAAWQSANWIDQFRKAQPALAMIVAPSAANHDALTILRLLRNSVHGSALQGMGVLRFGSPMQYLVGLPSEDEAQLLQAMDHLGGRSIWSVEQLSPGSSHFDPAILVDVLFDHIVRLINELMKATPVEQLDNVTLQPSDFGPPRRKNPSLTWEPFDEWTRLSIRWQLGF